MSKYTSETKRAIFFSAHRTCSLVTEVDAKFTSIAAAWRFISGYNPTHLVYCGSMIKEKRTTYDALQSMLKREGHILIDLVIDGITYHASLQYWK